MNNLKKNKIKLSMASAAIRLKKDGIVCCRTIIVCGVLWVIAKRKIRGKFIRKAILCWGCTTLG